jgi:hypothetical protein
VAAGALTLVAGVLDRNTQRTNTYINNTAGPPVSAAAVGSLTNVLPGRTGSLSDVVTQTDAEFVAVAFFRRALTAAEIADIVAYYGAA